MTKKLEEFNRQLEACKDDINCISRLAEEGRQIIHEMPPLTAHGPDVTVINCTVTVRNRVDYVVIGEIDPRCSGSGGSSTAIYQKYVFEYEAREEGFLQYRLDFNDIYLQAPAKSLYSFDKPSYFKILASSGYRQGTGMDYNGKCRLRKYPDGGFIDINSMNKTFSFVIQSPEMAPQGNIYFGPIAIVVRNSDTSCPDCSKSSYDPAIFTAARWPEYQGDRNSFQITRDDMKGAVQSGSFNRTLRWRESLNELGGYRDNTLIVTIEFEKTPGILDVSPAQPFNSAGPDNAGQFIPPSMTYTLSNTGQSPIQFGVSKKQTWLNLSKSGGSLAPGASSQVMASIVSSAKNLKAGTYKDQIVFTNATNGQGNTSRDASLEVGEIQVWDVKMTGQETDDMGGAFMYAKMNDVWKYITVDYGVRFDYVMFARFTIKKEKGVWKYVSGTIISGNVKWSNYFDPNFFDVNLSKAKCLNCQDVSNLAGASLGGQLSGNTVRLFWPKVITKVIVPNKLKGTVKSDQKSHKGWSDNYFESAEFLDRAGEHPIPLKNGETPFNLVKTSYKAKSKLDKRPMISISYRYLLKRIQ